MTDKLAATNGSPKTRTARNLESITKGALALDLQDRAKLRDLLIESVSMEVEALKQQAENAAKLLG